MIKIKGYSIWLEPKGSQKRVLDNLVSNIAAQYSVDKFAFHVTLLGGITGEEKVVKARTVSLAASLNPFLVELTDMVAMEDIWQKTLAIRAKQTEHLMEANRKAQRVFSIGNADYDPHASLIYAENMPYPQRNAVIKQLDSGIYSVSFPVESIHLYRTEGGIKDWTHLAEFRFG